MHGFGCSQRLTGRRRHGHTHVHDRSHTQQACATGACTAIGIGMPSFTHCRQRSSQPLVPHRQVSGVRKCHLQEGREAGNWGSIHVEIVGAWERVEACEQLIHQVVSGDHSGIGHATDTMPIEVHKISRLMGHRGQVVTLLKDLTGTYLDIQQGPCAGVPAGEAQIFMAGPIENIGKARMLIAEFLRMMDLVPASSDGSAGAEQLGLATDLSGVMAALTRSGGADGSAAIAVASAAQAPPAAAAAAQQAVDPTAALQQLLGSLPLELQAQLAAAGLQ
mmetsp:Transcript_15054/g.47287  ORF Transcript_15054/g.47287 Transcript_15054/m.47287 type:complete len:277 (+) Transcript_15054:108-938(+)